jgi:flagellar biosynthesis component FlhA
MRIVKINPHTTKQQKRHLFLFLSLFPPLPHFLFLFLSTHIVTHARARQAHAHALNTRKHASINTHHTYTALVVTQQDPTEIRTRSSSFSSALPLLLLVIKTNLNSKHNPYQDSDHAAQETVSPQLHGQHSAAVSAFT